MERRAEEKLAHSGARLRIPRINFDEGRVPASSGACIARVRQNTPKPAQNSGASRAAARRNAPTVPRVIRVSPNTEKLEKWGT